MRTCEFTRTSVTFRLTSVFTCRAIDGGQNALETFQQRRSRRQAAETSSRETLPQSHSPADACRKRIDRRTLTYTTAVIYLITINL